MLSKGGAQKALGFACAVELEEVVGGFSVGAPGGVLVFRWQFQDPVSIAEAVGTESGSRHLQKPGPGVRPSCQAAWHSRPASGSVLGFRRHLLLEGAAGKRRDHAKAG